MAKKKARKKKPTAKKSVETLTHPDDKRANIPTAELEPVVGKEDRAPKQLKYPRNTDLDPQLVWRGKDEQDWSDLVVNAPPLYIQEKVHPKVLVDDLLKQTQQLEAKDSPQQLDLFADFNGLPDEARSTEFYQHEANWTNRMILGDSLQVMASLAEREGLRGRVQCIYIDPPYGIRFNSNFQWSTTSNKVTDGKADHITREPEQVKAFRDTWRDGIHSYLTYLRDRAMVARDLLSNSGSVFVQIGDENVHRVRALMDEVFGSENFCTEITIQKTTSTGGPTAATQLLSSVCDYLLWYAKDKESVKYRQLCVPKSFGDEKSAYSWLQLADGSRRKMTKSEQSESVSHPDGARVYRQSDMTSQTGVEKTRYEVSVEGRRFKPNVGVWKTSDVGMQRLLQADRVIALRSTLAYVRFFEDFPVSPQINLWTDCSSSVGGKKLFVVQTNPRIIERCILMTTDPGDLVLDPTCGSGTTATVAEQWGRRWITIDTSRVSLALARARIMGARYPYYLLADSRAGQLKEAEVTRSAPSEAATYDRVRQGFVYERVPHITLKSIANNAEIDVIWDRFQETLESLREQLNQTLAQTWEEWEIPREAEEDWSDKAKQLHTEWWQHRIARQQEIDASIAAKADFEYLYDKPCEDKKTVRVAGPFTVESLSPHRTLGVDQNDELIDPRSSSFTQPAPAGNGDTPPKLQRGTTAVAESKQGYGQGVDDFVSVILENLRTSGVQQSAKEDRINFTSLTGWPGEYVCAKAQYVEGEDDKSGDEKTAGIFIGPEFGTVSRQDLVRAVRECADAGFDVLIACAFNYEAHAEDFKQLGSVPVLKARMNADLHMADDLKNTGQGNLFVIFGEPDIEIRESTENGHEGAIEVRIHGVDIFKPSTGEVVSDSTDGIACWFIDTDYNEESFFVRHAYFLGASDPYKSLRTTLKAEINEEAWSSLNSDTSRPFPKPKSGCIAVKVINHLGDEVMKVFRVE